MSTQPIDVLTCARWLRRLLITLVVTFFAALLGESPLHSEPLPRSAPLAWEPLSPLPDAEGFAAPFAGVHGDALIVAGGANFPGKKPWEGGTKVWHDTVFVLENKTGKWKSVGRLPTPRGYGMSLTMKNGIVCLGGSDASRHYDDCFLLRWNGRKLITEELPRLPKPCANMCGALIGDTIFIAGGIESPTATTASNTFWSLDLNNLAVGWRTLEPWPGSGRMLAVAGAQGGSFYLFGGAGLKPGKNGQPERIWLRDAYCFTPGDGWKRIPDLPRPVVAAPSPAPALGQSHLVVLGGDDGSQVARTPAEHQGFPREILAYHTVTGTWRQLGQLPFSLVATPVVEWNGAIVIPGGETRPGIRSNKIWTSRSTGQSAK